MSEAELREKIRNVLVDAEEADGTFDTEGAIVALILADRRAWGEYVIGIDDPMPTTNVLRVERNNLRAEQRQRNRKEGE